MMPKQTARVTPIRQDILGADAVQEIVEVAYNLWLSSAFRGGAPEGALFTALQMMREKTSAAIFLVPRLNSMSGGTK
jgi:hypothetical protein